ncbi:uncharacterized protein LOC127845071 isoform X2 [Dreissena polymorpha]|uniref:uncharacterized protein LOC127845071 isoform X2 n=1 Tax=Dreissena polymorpha TaxID=45954 RepID=UPI002263B6B3|nr:uncharacterized protein LOC127845071 isoform X2 [Dreissena polymorpha]
MLLAAVGIFALSWYYRRQQTKKTNQGILLFVMCCCCRRRQTMTANQWILNGDVERQTHDPGDDIEIHRTTFLSASYVKLSQIFPAKEIKMYFRQLKIDECTIQRIETEHPGNVREQCYQLFMEWEHMRTNKTMMSHLEWSFELIRKLKHHLDERLTEMPECLKKQCYSILDKHSREIKKKFPRKKTM